MAECAMSRRAQDIEADDAPAQPIQYGDLRMSTERDGGQTCLFWVRGHQVFTGWLPLYQLHASPPSLCYPCPGRARRISGLQRATVLRPVCGAAQG
jgi:hypothetical protein